MAAHFISSTAGWATTTGVTITPVAGGGTITTVAGKVIFDDVAVGVLRHIHGLDSPDYLGTIWEMIADYNEGKE